MDQLMDTLILLLNENNYRTHEMVRLFLAICSFHRYVGLLTFHNESKKQTFVTVWFVHSVSSGKWKHCTLIVCWRLL